ncbi:MAG TPA: hypothetical protein VLZ10_19660, partial [Thermodesulfobacteriota bacterium]|nr:hypothetical protein [Thermodesulfobacteriota bacterium]
RDDSCATEERQNPTAHPKSDRPIRNNGYMARSVVASGLRNVRSRPSRRYVMTVQSKNNPEATING